MGRKLVSVCYRAVGQNRAKGARASRHAVVNSSLVISSVVRSKLDDPKSSTRPQVRRDHPLSLSISISGGKETNKDSLSNGETGRAQLENRASWRWCSLEKRPQRRTGPKFPGKGRQRESQECLKLSGGSGWGRRCVGRMRAEQSGPPDRSVVDRRGLKRWPKPGFITPAEASLP
ncbi:hypothetical protein Bca4012_103567 [Brassica carinata]